MKLTGSKHDWRIRIGDWRVLYTIDDSAKAVDVAAIRHRSDANDDIFEDTVSGGTGIDIAEVDDELGITDVVDDTVETVNT